MPKFCQNALKTNNSSCVLHKFCKFSVCTSKKAQNIRKAPQKRKFKSTPKHLTCATVKTQKQPRSTFPAPSKAASKCFPSSEKGAKSYGEIVARSAKSLKSSAKRTQRPSEDAKKPKHLGFSPTKTQMRQRYNCST